jgi:hypothetical protein
MQSKVANAAAAMSEGGAAARTLLHATTHCSSGSEGVCQGLEGQTIGEPLDPKDEDTSHVMAGCCKAREVWDSLPLTSRLIPRTIGYHSSVC